ncbi:unnamed protein product, partial [Bubo scandiacus]
VCAREQQWLVAAIREGEWEPGVTAGQGGGGTLLSIRQDAEHTVWVRVWPGGVDQGQSQSHDHQELQCDAVSMDRSRCMFNWLIEVYNLFANKPQRNTQRTRWLLKMQDFTEGPAVSFIPRVGAGDFASREFHQL